MFLYVLFDIVIENVSTLLYKKVNKNVSENALSL